MRFSSMRRGPGNLLSHDVERAESVPRIPRRRCLLCDYQQARPTIMMFFAFYF